MVIFQAPAQKGWALGTKTYRLSPTVGSLQNFDSGRLRQCLFNISAIYTQRIPRPSLKVKCFSPKNKYFLQNLRFPVDNNRVLWLNMPI